MISIDKAKQIRSIIEEASVSLTDESALEAIELFPKWKSSFAYQINDRVRYEDILYKCVQAHTSQDDWTPEATPALWTVVSIEEWPQWRQPTGAQDAYMLGDKVTHNAVHWISNIDNNIWEPGVFGWDFV